MQRTPGWNCDEDDLVCISGMCLFILLFSLSSDPRRYVDVFCINTHTHTHTCPQYLCVLLVAMCVSGRNGLNRCRKCEPTRKTKPSPENPAIVLCVLRALLVSFEICPARPRHQSSHTMAAKMDHMLVVTCFDAMYGHKDCGFSSETMNTYDASMLRKKKKTSRIQA